MMKTPTKTETFPAVKTGASSSMGSGAAPVTLKPAARASMGGHTAPVVKRSARSSMGGGIAPVRI